jgi:hypothetical protein
MRAAEPAKVETAKVEAEPTEPEAETAEAAKPAPEAPKGDALKYAAAPAADAPVEGRALTALLPNLDVQALQGWTKEAVALRQRAFIELPASFFVFAAADSEVMLVTSIDGKLAETMSADGAQLSMALDELSTKAANGPHVRLRALPAEVPLEQLTTDRDPRLKTYEQLRHTTEACVARVRSAMAGDDETDALAKSAKRCSASKLEKAKKKLEAELRKAYSKKRASELVRVDKRLKTLFSDERVSSTGQR